MARPLLSSLTPSRFTRSSSDIPCAKGNDEIPTSKRFERVSSDISGDDEKDAVIRFKTCMEEIKRDYPHLSIGARRQMALKQCSEMNGDQGKGRGHNQKGLFNPDDLFHGVLISWFHLGSQSSVAPASGSSAEGAGSAPAAGKLSSLAPRQSVVVSEDQAGLLKQLSFDESDNSLVNSLEEIEKSSPGKMSDRRPKRSMKCSSMRSSRRVSGLSLELSDVEESDAGEDEEPQDLGNNNDPPSDEVILDVFESLPDEIKSALGGHLGANKKEAKSASPSQERRKGRDTRNSSITNSTRLLSESFLFDDSANFAGDFWAWKSFNSRGSS